MPPPSGGSLTALMVIVMRLATGSVSAPPLAVPPLSLTWKVKLAAAVPLTSAAGTYFRLPVEMSLTVTN